MASAITKAANSVNQRTASHKNIPTKQPKFLLRPPCRGKVLNLNMPQSPRPMSRGRLRASPEQADEVLAELGVEVSSAEPSGNQSLTHSGRPGEDDKWLFSALVLTLGSIVPNLIAGAKFAQILELGPWQRLAALIALDGLFSFTSYAFLILSESFNMQRHGSTPKYPGPWTVIPLQMQGRYEKPVRNPPKFFKKYVQVLPLGTGVILPFGLLVLAVIGSPHRLLAAATILPYLLTVFVQIKQEAIFVREGSPVWPMVPVVHMLYRFLQLARGAWLVAALQGPEWQIWLMAYLGCLWCFNFGCVMAWMAPMYYWHRQPLRLQLKKA